MERQLVHLSEDQLDGVAAIGVDGSIAVDSNTLSRLLAKSLGLIGLRVAVSQADYLEHESGVAEPGTRTVTGIWWHSHGDDTATIGGFVIEGLAMTITTEGEGESPLAEDGEILDRATKAIASQYEDAAIVETGLVNVPSPAGGKLARVVVTRDYRVRRPQDILGPDELSEFSGDRLGLAVVQVIGDGRALVTRHGV